MESTPNNPSIKRRFQIDILNWTLAFVVSTEVHTTQTHRESGILGLVTGLQILLLGAGSPL